MNNETIETSVLTANNETAPTTPTLASVARWLIILTTGFYLLRELSVILKPLLLAVLFAYIILPVHQQVKKRVPSRFVLVTMGVISLAILGLMGLWIQTSAQTLLNEFPALSSQARSMIKDLQGYTQERFPSLAKSIAEFSQSEQSTENLAREWLGKLAGLVADTFSVAVVVGLYLMFMLLEVGRFPARVRSAFSDMRAQQIMETIAGINQGIADYLRAKVYGSLALAVPIWMLMTVFGVRFALVWAVLNFFANFIPYLGSVAGYGLPTIYALLQFGFGWEIITIAILMLAIHLITAMVAEPAIIGKAVGVSPLVILIALAFWGYCWGLIGMFLAVPLTVIAKIICSHIPATMPIAKLVSDE